MKPIRVLSWFFLIIRLTLPCYLIGFVHANGHLHQGVYNGKELTVLAYNFPPTFTYKIVKNGSYEFGGFAKEILEATKYFFNMSIKYTVLDPVEVTKYGLWGAIYGPLDKKEVDIVPFLFIQDLESVKHMEVSAAMWIDPLKILQPWPEEESRLKVTTRPFQLPVWLCFIGSTLVFILSTTFFIKMNIGYEWLLCMIVLINAYFGVMTSLLTVPKLEPIASTVEEVAKSDVSWLTNAESGFQKIIGDKLREDPTLFVSDAVNALENVVHRKCVYIGGSSIIGFIIHEDTKSNGYCRMTASPELKTSRGAVLQIGFPIGSAYASAFDEFTLRMWACGIVALYKQRYFPSADQCRTDVPPKTNTGPLKLVDLTGPFFFSV